MHKSSKIWNIGIFIVASIIAILVIEIYTLYSFKMSPYHQAIVNNLENIESFTWNDLRTKLKYTSNRDNQIILLTVNRGFADMLMNWLCSIKHIPELNNILFYSMDESLSNELADAGYNVYSPETALALLGNEINSDLAYGTCKHITIIVRKKNIYVFTS